MCSNKLVWLFILVLLATGMPAWAEYYLTYPAPTATDLCASCRQSQHKAIKHPRRHTARHKHHHHYYGIMVYYPEHCACCPQIPQPRSPGKEDVVFLTRPADYPKDTTNDDITSYNPDGSTSDDDARFHSDMQIN